MRLWLSIVLSLTLVMTTTGVEAKHVVINSADWMDVYSGMLYASLKGYDSLFLTSEYDGKELVSRIPKTDTSVILVESKDIPYIPNFETELTKAGFSVQKVVSTDDETANMQLATDVETRNFIVVGSGYGYDAISVAPYAVKTNSYVLFLEETPQQTISYLKTRQADQILLYGYIDEESTTLFNEFDPEYINEGDKYLDNVEIVRRFHEMAPTPQAHVTTGDFMEISLFSKDYPNIFVGEDSIPEATKELIRQKTSIAIVIGNELFNVMTNLKEDLGKEGIFLSVIVKYGRGTGAGGAMTSVRLLDMFYVPSPATNISVVSVKYNLFTHQLEVSYKNNENTPTYFKSVITIFTDGERRKTIGDEEIRLLPPGEITGIGYDIDLTELLDSRMVLDVRIFTQYGAGVISLTNIYEETFKDIEVFSAEDKSQGRINSMQYNRNSKAFEVGIENLGDEPFYYRLELEFTVNGKVVKPITSQTGVIPGKSTRIALVPFDMPSGATVSDVRATLLYGEREDFLSNKFEREFPFAESDGFWMWWIVLILIALIVVLYFIYRKVSDW